VSGLRTGRQAEKFTNYAEVKKEWSYTSTFLRIFVACIGAGLPVLTIILLHCCYLATYHLNNTVPYERCDISAYREECKMSAHDLGTSSRFSKVLLFGCFSSVDRTASVRCIARWLVLRTDINTAIKRNILSSFLFSGLI
jgi:hypothetical protein